MLLGRSRANLQGTLPFGGLPYRKPANSSNYMKVLYHNKGIDMINIPNILNNTYVRNAIPSINSNDTPPNVSFKYTKTMAGKIFNHKRN